VDAVRMNKYNPSQYFKITEDTRSMDFKFQKIRFDEKLLAEEVVKKPENKLASLQII